MVRPVKRLTNLMSIDLSVGWHVQAGQPEKAIPLYYTFTHTREDLPSADQRTSLEARSASRSLTRSAQRQMCSCSRRPSMGFRRAGPALRWAGRDGAVGRRR